MLELLSDHGISHLMQNIHYFLAHTEYFQDTICQATRKPQ